MKKLFLIVIPALLFFSSCEYMPYADFSASSDNASTGEVIYFDNYSDHTYTYDWDFGDGYYSSLANPSHSYASPGTYRVTLTAYGNNDEYDQAYLYVTVSGGSASLEVTVREWREDTYYGALIPFATVTLYTNENDFYYWENPVVSGTTDANGKIVFSGLEPRTYYVDVYNTKYNNELLYNDDVNFVRTAPLEMSTYNLYTAYVDYNPKSLKSTEKRTRTKEKSAKERLAPEK